MTNTGARSPSDDSTSKQAVGTRSRLRWPTRQSRHVPDLARDLARAATASQEAFGVTSLISATRPAVGRATTTTPDPSVAHRFEGHIPYSLQAHARPSPGSGKGTNRGGSLSLARAVGKAKREKPGSDPKALLAREQGQASAPRFAEPMLHIRTRHREALAQRRQRQTPAWRGLSPPGATQALTSLRC